MKKFIYKKIAVSMTLVLLCGTAFARKVISEEDPQNSDPSAVTTTVVQPQETPLEPPYFLDLTSSQISRNTGTSSSREPLSSGTSLHNSGEASLNLEELPLFQQQQLEIAKRQEELETQKQKIAVEQKEVELRKKELELKEKEFELKEKQIAQEREHEKILAEQQRIKEEAEAQRLREETEAQRIREAEAQRIKEEAEQQRIREEAEAQHPLQEPVPIVAIPYTQPPSSPPSVAEYAIRKFLKGEDIGWVQTREDLKKKGLSFWKSFIK